MNENTNVLPRRTAIASALGGVFALVTSKYTATAQQATQQTSNGASIVATGDVHLGQQASASQTVRGAGSITGTGIQVVTNDGRIVATGDVWVNQDAAASQDVAYNTGDSCTPGEFSVVNDVLFFCTSDCRIRAFSCDGGCHKGHCR